MKRHNLEFIQTLAAEKGGKFLSDTYHGNYIKYNWECSNKHVWKANAAGIIKGSWCPSCSAGTGERICRVFFEQLFKTDFPKVKPEWLLSERGFKMELDGYSAKYKIAFEHQGTQHTLNRKHFQDNYFNTKKKSLFEIIQHRDTLKLKLCCENGILLIQVPSILETLGIDNVKGFIKNELLKNHYPLPCNFSKIQVMPEQAYNFNKIIEYRKIVETKGGKLLTHYYIDSKSPLAVICNKGHQWETTANNLKTGKWCKQCAGLQRLTIEHLQNAVSKRGGKLLSNNYQNNKAKMLWQCSKGHTWKAATDQVINRGRWCPACAGCVKKTIAEMQKLAESRGGKCLSRVYVNKDTNMRWRCSKGHTWKATPRNVAKATWCPVCALKKGRNRRKVFNIGNQLSLF